MKLPLKTLTRLLASQGFSFSGSIASFNHAFVRPCSQSPLFQWVMVDCAGRTNEAVVGLIAVSVTKHFLFKGLSEIRLLDQVAEDEERGWTIVDSLEKQTKWETNLASISPSVANAFASELGPIIIERTEGARIAVARYLNCLRENSDATYELGRIRMEAGQTTAQFAERIVNSPGVLQIEGAENKYLVATMCILLNYHSVDKAISSSLLVSPLENEELMWRIQLLTDALLAE